MLGTKKCSGMLARDVEKLIVSEAKDLKLKIERGECTNLKRHLETRGTSEEEDSMPK